jgi:PAS domain S-box-containing protein
VIRRGESIILNDYEASLRSAQSVHHVNPEGALREEIPEDVERARSAMIIPLKLEQEVIGVLQIFCYKLNAFTDEHLMLTEAMAFHGAAAQNNALLYKMAEDEVIERTRAEQLRNALYRISQTVHSSDSLDDILDEIYSVISEVLSASSFYFAFLDDEKNIITFPYFHDEYDIRPADRKLGKGLTEYVLERGEGYLWRASQPDPTEGGKIEVLGRDAAVWLGVPLMDRDKAIGVMAVQNYDNENAYGDREREILDFVATEVSRAIVAMRAVRSIRESEDKYRSLIENTREGIFLWAGDHLEVVNQPFCDLFGYSAETVCSPNFDLSILISESQRAEIVEIVKKFQPGAVPQPQIEMLMVASDGREFEAEVGTNIIKYKDKVAIQGIVRDISQRRHIEAQLLQTAKLEAIGRLAGGVAHDFNNLLTALSGTAELMLLKITPDNPNYDDLEQILTIARRGSNLTQQLLAFARSQPQQPKVFQLNSIVEGTQQMLRRLIGDTIKLSLNMDAKLPTVKADPAQLEMALMNLIVNSRDAMSNGGKITITTGTEEINEENLPDNPGIDLGSYVVLTVSDQGVGMPKEVLDRATDPFFTTKPIGKGTGLGLSTVHGIARQSGGVLKIESQVGIGTTVRLFLPVSGEEIIQDTSIGTIGVTTEGKETILVCDDEDSVRQVAVRLLRTKGYHVLEANEGQHAMEIAGAFSGKIDLLLTDMAMPVMGGPELAHHLKAIRPNLKVIMMSGYSPMAFPTDYDFEEPKDFIQKPFRAHQLTTKVREILNRTKEDSPQTF